MRFEKGDLVGRCPEHSYIGAEDIEYRFPEPCRCLLCGSEIEVAINDKPREVKQ